MSGGGGGGGGRPGALVAVKMEVAAPFYGHEGLELLPDFAQLPGFGNGPGPGVDQEGPEAGEDSGVAQHHHQHHHKLLLAGKKPLRDLLGSASSPGNAALALALAPSPPGPFPSLRLRGGPAGAVHRLIPETVGGVPEVVGPSVLQPLLKLPAAADLEQLLLQAGPASPGTTGGGGGGGPVAVPGGPFLYRSPPPPPPTQPVTQEQEGFADGFVKALADLHKQNQLLGGSPAAPGPPLSPAQQQQHGGGGPPSRQDSPAVYTTLGGFNPGSPVVGGGAFFSGPPGRLLEEPQTVPESPGAPPLLASGPALSSGESPPPPSSSSSSSSSAAAAAAAAAALSPLDAESQERLKAERKRLRNRIAASKCRRRKLERIARLEEKVKALKGQNAQLAATAGLLRAQVAQLQGRVRSHLSSGCHINPQGGPSPRGPHGDPPPPEASSSAC